MRGYQNILAECPGLGSVSACTCGCIHVKVGPVEIALEPAAFAQSALMFRQAIEALEKGAMRIQDLQECFGTTNGIKIGLVTH